MLNFGQSEVAGRDKKPSIKCKLIPNTHMSVAFALLSLHTCQDLNLLSQVPGLDQVTFQPELTEFSL